MLYRLRILIITLALANSQCIFKNKSNNFDGLRLAWESEPLTIDPRYATEANSQYLSDLIHCALISFDANGHVIPSLATEWIWQTPTKLLLSIKDQILFSNSNPVTLEDVLSTYQYVVFNKDSPFITTFKNVAKISIEEKKLAFELKEPDATMLTNLTVGIVPKDYANKPLLTKNDLVPGCGPYKIDNYSVNHIKLKNNEHYNIRSAPLIQNIMIDIVKDETTRFSKLRKGEVDLIQRSLNRDKIKEIQKSYPNLQVQSRAGLNTSYIGFNMKDPLIKQLEVRQAIAQSIDRDAVIKHVLGGMAVPAKTLLTPEDTFINQAIEPVTRDLALAKSNLSRVLGDKLSKTTLTLTTTTDLTRITVAKAIASQIQELGIKVQVQSLEWGKFKEEVDKGNLQMWLLNWIGFKDPDIYRYAFATESFPPSGGNRGFYSNSVLDKTLLNARKETNKDKRKELYNKAQQILSEQLPYVFLWHEDNFAVMNKRVKNYTVYADGRYSSLSEASILK